MARCKEKEDLEVHHIKRDGTNELKNARVLCHNCHEKTNTYGEEGGKRKEFTQNTKDIALKLAGEQCECRGCSACDMQKEQVKGRIHL